MQNCPNPCEAPLSPPRGRGRPRAFDRDAALEAAMQLFWRKGYAAAAISDLTEAMGIGPTSLYAAFGSKEALYAEALRHYQTLYEGLVWDGFLAAPTARAAITALLLDSAAALTQPCGESGALGCMMTLSTVDGDATPDLEAILQQTRSGIFDRVHTRLTRAQAEGELPATLDAPALARFVVTLQNGMSLQARSGVRRAELEAAVRLALTGWEAWVA